MLVGRLLSLGNVRQTTRLVSCHDVKLHNNDTKNLCHILAFNGNAKVQSFENRYRLETV